MDVTVLITGGCGEGFENVPCEQGGRCRFLNIAILYLQPQKTYIMHKILQIACVYGRFGVCMFVLNIHEHTFMQPAVSVVLKSETNSFSHRN